MIYEKELLFLTSIHEAAHALVGDALGGTIEQISLTLNDIEQRGHVTINFPDPEGSVEFLRNSVKVGLASEMAFEVLGISAERRERNDTRKDLRDAEFMARSIYTKDGVVDPQSADKFLEIAKREVRQLLFDQQDKLLKFAAEIAKLNSHNGMMDGNESRVTLERIIGRSISGKR